MLAQSVYFLIKAWKRGLAIGMGKEKLRRIAHGGGVHHRPGGGDCHQRHHAGQDLGVPLPWLRLSVVEQSFL